MIFFIVAAISFGGSIHIGAVNLAVVQATLNRNISAGILVAIGGSIPEFIYSFIALKGVFFLKDNQFLLSWLNWLIIPIFLLMGLVYLFRKESNSVDKISVKDKSKLDFLKGFSLGMLNPQLLPFWFFMLIFLNKYFAINDLSAKYAFVLGTGMGAFAILALFAYLAHRYKLYINQLLSNFSVNRLMGYLFISLALIQAVKVFA